MSAFTIRKPTAALPAPAAAQTSTRDLSQWLLTLTFVIFLFGNTSFKTTAYALVLAIYLILGALKIKDLLPLAVSSQSLLLLWALVVGSYFWSYIPRVTLDVILSQTAFLIFAICIAIRHQATGFALSLQRAALIQVGLVVMFCLAFPGASYYWAGLKAFYIHKNLLGGMMALCALVLIFTPGRNKWHVVCGIVAVGLLLASQSKTAIALFMVCCALLQFANWWAKTYKPQAQQVLLVDIFRAILLAATLIGLVALVVFRDELFDLLWSYLPKTALTGRGALWLAVVQQVRGHSLLGIGPGVFWQGGGAAEIAQTTLYQNDPYWVQRMGSADGSYIDLVASLGMLGLALFLLTMVDLFRRLFQNWNQPDSRLVFVLATFVVLQAVTESTVLHSTNLYWLIYLLCYFRAASYAAFNSTSWWKKKWL